MKSNFDRRFLKKGLIAGIDEAGRGALAGPLIVAVTVFDVENIPDIAVEDSKKLSPKKREQLFEIIMEQAVCCKVAAVSPYVIDSINIVKATLLGIERVFNLLDVKPTVVLIDGNLKPFLPAITYAVVDGDAKSFAVASASIVAKVVRDRIMRKYDSVYPGYGFFEHKGYGTKRHINAIKSLGTTPIHRKTFVRRILEGG